MKLLEFIHLAFLPLTVKVQTLWMYLCDRKRYYKNKPFKILDQALIRLYRFKNPYRICKKYVLSKGFSDGDVYGETPLAVYEQIIKIANLKRGKTFYDLGSGRGRGLFFTHLHSSCNCIGIEFVDEFCKLSNQLLKSFSIENIQVIKKNFLRASYQSADAIYICSTLMTEQEISQLISCLLTCNKKTLIFTTSFALSEYSDQFRLIGEFEERFLFGRTSVFVNALA